MLSHAGFTDLGIRDIVRKGERRGGEEAAIRMPDFSLRFHLLPEDDLSELAGTLKRTAPWHVARRRMSWLARSLARHPTRAAAAAGTRAAAAGVRALRVATAGARRG